MRDYYQKNKEAITEQRRNYYQENKEAIAEQKKNYYQKNKETRIANYIRDNKEAIAKQHTANIRKRYRTDDGFRVEVNLRSRMRKAMKGTKKSANTMKLTGSESGTQLKEYLDLVY